jgi:hypothetical protein
MYNTAGLYVYLLAGVNLMYSLENGVEYQQQGINTTEHETT